MGESRIFLALDGMSTTKATQIANYTSDYVAGGKATDLIEKGGAGVLDHMGFGKRFLDAKIHDVAQTVSNRVLAYRGHADFLTVHASMSPEALRAAVVAANESNIKLLAVSVLTDITPRQCKKIYGDTLKAKVLDFAMKARRAGCHGIVCSPREVKLIGKAWGAAIIVTPSVRSEGSDHHNQKRVGTPFQAIVDGADYIVCGRQVFNKPGATAQLQEIVRINFEVGQALQMRRQAA